MELDDEVKASCKSCGFVEDVYWPGKMRRLTLSLEIVTPTSPGLDIAHNTRYVTHWLY